MTDTSIPRQVRRGCEWVRSSATALRQRYRGWRTARRALRELELGRSPDGSTVVVACNRQHEAQHFALAIDGQRWPAELPPRSIATWMLPAN